MKNNNVIELPIREKDQKRFKMRLSSDQLKLGLATSLLSVLFLVTIANHSLLDQDDMIQGVAAIQQDSMARADRFVASVETPSREWEKSVARELSKITGRSAVAVGRQPSALEKLTLGVLEGRYTVRLQDGKLQSLEFAAETSDTNTPKVIANRMSFLQEHAGLLPVSFKTTVKTASEIIDGRTVETYDLINGDKFHRVQVRFELDGGDRLVSMKVIETQVAAN